MRFAMLCSVVLLSACSFAGLSPSSMNIQRAGLRDTADMATTVALDATPVTDVEATQTKVKAITLSVQSFIKTGDVDSLTLKDLQDLLIRVVPEKYQYIATMLLSKVQGVNLPVDKLGANNIRRLDEICYGVLVACDKYSVADRPVPKDEKGE